MSKSILHRLITGFMTGLLFVYLLPAQAHEFWIEPGAFRADAGVRVPLTLYVGQHFAGTSIPYLPESFEKFFSNGPDGKRAIVGTLGDDPAGQFSATMPGRYSIALITHPLEVIFDTGEEFESYLIKEGLERHLVLHRESDKPGKKIIETYFRCAKTLITVGSAPVAPPDLTLGLPLELVAEQLPGTKGGEARLRLLFHGQPLEGALVLFMNKMDPRNKISVRTDREGRVRVQLTHQGTWLANSVQMLKAPFYVRENWNSVWASLTFEVK